MSHGDQISQARFGGVLVVGNNIKLKQKNCKAYRSSALRAALVALFFSAAISSAFCIIKAISSEQGDHAMQYLTVCKVRLTKVSALIRSTKSVYSSVNGSFDFSGLSALSPVNFSYLQTVQLPVRLDTFCRSANDSLNSRTQDTNGRLLLCYDLCAAHYISQTHGRSLAHGPR